MIRDNSEYARENENLLEFPGGKVEKPDRSIYDTAGRELWEELFLQGRHEGEYLENWAEVKRSIITNPENPKHHAWIEIMQRLVDSNNYFKKSGSDLKTLYFMVKIPKSIALYLVEHCGAYLVDVKAIQDAKKLISNGPFSKHRAISRKIEIPTCTLDADKYMQIRDRDLFCIPANPFAPQN
jgi:hypothetical protein